MDAAKGQADERGKISSFETIPLTELHNWLQAAQKEGKFVFIADMHGNAHNFMTYSA